MWIRKNPKELLNSGEPFKFNIYKYLIIFLFFILLPFLLAKYFGNGYKGRLSATPPEPLSWAEAISQIPIYIILAAFLTALVYYFEKNKSKIKSQTVICDKCYTVSKDNGNKKCDCGGELVNIDLMKWIDE